MAYFIACLARPGLANAAKLQQLRTIPPGLSTMEKDTLCICRHFKKRNGSNFGAQGADDFCESIGFHDRWEPLFPGRVELGVGVGGLRALVFKSKIKMQNSVIFAFRDFLHEKLDYFIDDDAAQKIAMYGEVTLVDRVGSEGTARFLSGLMFSVRHYLGFDYHRHACAFVNELMKHAAASKNAIFTGYGFGGSIAILQALRLDQSTGITFSAHGVKEYAAFFGYRTTTKRVTNLILNSDVLLGNQTTRQCTFEAPVLYNLLGEHSSVMSDHGFIEVDTVRSCEDPED